MGLPLPVFMEKTHHKDDPIGSALIQYNRHQPTASFIIFSATRTLGYFSKYYSGYPPDDIEKLTTFLISPQDSHGIN